MPSVFIEKRGSYHRSYIIKTKVPHLQVIPGFFVLDPDFSLRLGVDQEGKSGSLCDNYAILNGQVIIREPL